MSKTVVLYHKDCNDGTTAAAVVLRKFPNAKTFPFSYDYSAQEINKVLNELDSETQVFTVDCIIGVKNILDVGYKVTTIDHHIGAKDEYEKIAQENKNFTFIFENNRSGASLTWKYFFPEDEIPELVKLVEDSDLFIHKYGQDTKDVHSYLSMYQNTPEAVITELDRDLVEIINKGKIISQYYNKKLSKQLETLPIFLKINEYEIPTYNIQSIFTSEAGRIFAEKNNKTVGIFSISGNKVKISFRSFGEQVPDALTIAKILGGGGHKRAAAAFLSLGRFLEMIIK